MSSPSPSNCSALSKAKLIAKIKSINSKITLLKLERDKHRRMLEPILFRERMAKAEQIEKAKARKKANDKARRDEEYRRVLTLRSQGKKIADIAAEMGWCIDKAGRVLKYANRWLDLRREYGDDYETVLDRRCAQPFDWQNVSDQATAKGKL